MSKVSCFICIVESVVIVVNVSEQAAVSDIQDMVSNKPNRAPVESGGDSYSGHENISHSMETQIWMSREFWQYLQKNDRLNRDINFMYPVHRC